MFSFTTVRHYDSSYFIAVRSQIDFCSHVYGFEQTRDFLTCLKSNPKNPNYSSRIFFG